MSFEDAYRNAMSLYAGHVQVITTAYEGVRRGVTATAACSVSDNPPTVLACVNLSNPRNEIFFKSDCFAINTLAADHRDIAGAFSGEIPMTEEERFEHGKWRKEKTGAPTLRRAAAVFDCRLIEAKPVATHMILIGKVEFVHVGAAGSALLYYDRAYTTISARD